MINPILGANYQTLRNETITITEIHDDRVVGVITSSPDTENINQYDMFLNTTVIVEEIK